MTFRVGQKVVCIDAKFRDYPCPLREGAIYAVRGFNTGYDNGGIGVLLEESQGGVRPSGEERGFYLDRFRPLIERSTDTGFAILKRLEIPSDRKIKERA